MANTKKKRVRRTKAQIEADKAKELTQIDYEGVVKIKDADYNIGEPTKGLGDKVEKVLEATGVKAVVKAVLGDDCGCEERKQKLNLLGWGKVNCLEDEEYNYLHAFFESNPKVVRPSEQIELVKIARRVFNRKYEVSGCSGCVRDLVNKLKAVYETYKGND